jgi:hypothetical protein
MRERECDMCDGYSERRVREGGAIICLHDEAETELDQGGI